MTDTKVLRNAIPRPVGDPKKPQRCVWNYLSAGGHSKRLPYRGNNRTGKQSMEDVNILRRQSEKKN